MTVIRLLVEPRDLLVILVNLLVEEHISHVASTALGELRPRPKTWVSLSIGRPDADLAEFAEARGGAPVAQSPLVELGPVSSTNGGTSTPP